MTWNPILPAFVLVLLGMALLGFCVFALVRAADRRRRINWALRLAACALVVLAAFRPGIGSASAPNLESDVDVLFVVDTTASMVPRPTTIFTTRTSGAHMTSQQTAAGQQAAAGWSGSAAQALPADGTTGTLVGRVWDPAVGGPSPVLVTEAGVLDLSRTFATVSDITEAPDPAAAVRAAAADAPSLGSLEELFANTEPDTRDESKPWLLAPVDLHVLKAAGVTFAVSMIERVIEERVRGDIEAAARMREQILAEIGTDLASLKPGSEEATALKAYLVGEGLWSQYLEVGIGPDAEIFTKAPVLASVGWGAEVGVRSDSAWNNPEPEVVVVCDPAGRPVGASLGNDVNLRDIEGRSALLLGKAKDNNASASVGPFIRLFDEGFGMDDVRAATVRLEVEGTDGFVMTGESSMSLISRDPEELVRQTLSAHQYPDGFALYLGTMFAPIEDRDAPGKGFTHKIGDRVRVSSEKLGVLENIVAACDQAPPWTFGVLELMRNLAGRGLLGAAA